MSIGGVDVTVRKRLCDSRYREYGFDGFAIKPGHYHLDGDGALAYAGFASNSANSTSRRRPARATSSSLRAIGRRGGFLNDPAGFVTAMGELLSTKPRSGHDRLVRSSPAITVTRDHMFRSRHRVAARATAPPTTHGVRPLPRVT